MDSTQAIRCTGCSAPLPVELLNQNDLIPCPSCDAQLRVDVFPAQFNPVQTQQASELVQAAGEASCYYHPAKKAVIPCEGCGRFLCALCDVEFNGQHLCATCLESGKRKGKIKNLQNTRVLYDTVALALALFPLLLFWLTIVTAPAALFIAIRHWNTPSSIIPRTKIRFVFAIIISLLQIVGWTIGIYAFVTSD